MANAGIVVSKDLLGAEQRARLVRAFSALVPDNIVARTSEVTIDEPGLWIRSPAGLVAVSAEEIRLRADRSRTWWWAANASVAVVSTSQRFVISVLGGFEPNREAFAWMLSSGTLGPGHSWDRRVAPIPANAELVLGRNSLRIAISEDPKEFRPEARSDAEHERALIEALAQVFGEFPFDPARWIVPLSGGFDSRALLLLAPNAKEFRTITWGTRKALADANTDAAVARDFARAIGVENRYFETDLSPEPIEKIFARFLTAGEGRVDHFAGYLDGFAVWKHLYESNVTGILRGDEGFGWVPVASLLDVVHSVGLSAIRDFAGATDLIEGTGQALPASLVHRTGESAATWRDRLYHEFRVPVILAALNALKAPYVEVAAPLLDERLLALVRTQPDHLRTSKVLFKKIVTARSPNVRFATRSATADPKEVLASQRMSAMIADELSSAHARALFGGALTAKLLPTKKADPLAELRAKAVRALKTRIKETLPVWMRRAARNTVVKHRLDRKTLAFRAFLISRMVKMLG